MTRSVKTALTACTAAAALFALPAGAHAGTLSLYVGHTGGDEVPLATIPAFDCSSLSPLDGVSAGTVSVKYYTYNGGFASISTGLGASVWCHN